MFRRGRRGSVERPFIASAEVRCRGYSFWLQRAMVDFGADEAFAGAAKKLKEHYGIEAPVSAMRSITENHGECMREQTPLQTELPNRPGVPQLIAEMDGSMIPKVEIAALPEGGAKVDRRKTRTVGWKEARLCLVHEPGSVTPVFGATLGTVDEAGEQMLNCAIHAGMGMKTKVHGVGDGAEWIAGQIELQFGSQGRYLVDLYHLCEYLAPAAESIAGTDKRTWVEKQKQKLKENRTAAVMVIEDLLPFVDPDSVPDSAAPVRACHRYMTNRPGQFDYQAALQKELPVGSGEIESAHRYVIQARLKLAGAWWKTDNAAKMLALRVCRANSSWDNYWNNLHPRAA